MRQSLPPAELFLVDDGSKDASRSVATQLGVEVVALGRTHGRGAVRAIALERAQHELVLCCDATNELPPDFAAQALHWFENPRVAAVFGRIWQIESRSVADRWRARHLFKLWEPLSVQHGALLSTYGCILRRSAVLEVGNFDAALRHSEDAELGRRLLAAGFDVIRDPSLYVYSVVSNSPIEVLDRYWRWNAGEREAVSFTLYLKLVLYSLKVQVPHDLRDRDVLAVGLSLLCPHYQFWKSLWRQIFGRVQV